jgi:hypothetical protein
MSLSTLVLASCVAVFVDVRNDCWISQFPFVSGVRVTVSSNVGGTDAAFLGFGQSKEFLLFGDARDLITSIEISATLETRLPAASAVQLGTAKVRVSGNQINYTFSVSQLDTQKICLKGLR